MTSFLVLSLRLIDRRYHGMPESEWPPAPGRVFQSLVAGVARGAHFAAPYVVALEWLEGLGPPTITAPRRVLGQRLELFVPDNDRDVERDLAELRVSKTVVPRLIESDAPIVYSWRIHEPSTHVDTVKEAAEQLYQLGRGVDMAWGLAEVLDEAGLQARLAEHPGDTYRPILDSGDGRAGVVLPCPQRGTLQSLRERFDKQRFFETKEGRVTRTTFEQPPRAVLASVVYGAADSLVLFDLVDPEREASLQAWPLREAAQLVTRLRDLAAARLREHAEAHALPDIERALIGRKPDGSNEGPPSERVQVTPLPSIGHEHADEAIRRVAVRIPTKCSLLAERVLWAFSGLAYFEEDSGVVRFVLAQSTDQRMLNRYRVTSARWQSKTAVALPEGAQRRRIEPARQRDEAKGAPERLDEESRAARAVMQAVRHAGISEPVDEIRVQREPFGRHGRKAEEFASGTRFAKERLWHVDLTFRQRLAGPLVIGDGRFLGLGVLFPADEVPSVLVLSVESKRDVDPLKMAHAFRRAALARLERVSGGAKLNEYFTGHKADEEPTDKYVEPWHVAFHWDPLYRCLLAIPPHAFRYPEQGPRSHEDWLLRRLASALDGLVELVAGSEGRHVVARASSLDHRRYLESDTTWTSATPYTVTRHRKRDSAQAALIEDALAECHRRKLPAPTVEVLDCVGVSGRGLQGRLRLRFPVRIPGPLALGRTAYLGGGLFLPDQR